MPTTGGHAGPPHEDIATGCVNISFCITIKCTQFPIILAACRRGGPMCPPGRNIIHFVTMLGEFAMPFTSGHCSIPMAVSEHTRFIHNPCKAWKKLL